MILNDPGRVGVPEPLEQWVIEKLAGEEGLKRAPPPREPVGEVVRVVAGVAETVDVTVELARVPIDSTGALEVVERVGPRIYVGDGVPVGGGLGPLLVAVGE